MWVVTYERGAELSLNLGILDYTKGVFADKATGELT